MGDPHPRRRTWSVGLLSLVALALIAAGSLRPAPSSAPPASQALAPPPPTTVEPPVQDDPALAALVLREARALSRDGTPTGLADAAELLEAASRTVDRVKLAPLVWGDLQLDLGRVRLAQGRVEAAIALFEAVVKDAPERVDALRELAGALERTASKARALQIAERAVQLAPKEVVALKCLGELLLARRQFGPARETFQRAVDVREDDAAAYVGLGRAQFGLGLLPDAQDALTEAIDIEPASPVGYYYRGVVQVRRFRLRQAQRDFETAGRRDPASPFVSVGLGRVHELRGEDARAEACFRRAAQDPRTAAEALARLARLLLWRADPIRALAEGRSPAQRATALRLAREALAAARVEDPDHALVARVARRLKGEAPLPLPPAPKDAWADDEWEDEAPKPHRTEAEFLLARGQRFRRLAKQSRKRAHLRSAELALSLAWTLDPRLIDGYLEYAQMCAESGARGPALLAARRVVALDPMRVDGHLLIASLLGRKAGATPEARVVIETAVGAARGEDRVGALLAKAKLQLAEGGRPEHLRAARATLAAAAALMPKQPEPFERAAQVARRWRAVCRRLGDAAGEAQATALGLRLEADRQGRITELLRQAEQFKDRLNYSDAIEALDQALLLDPTHAEALSVRAVCHLKIGNFIPGTLDYSRAVELDPRWMTGEPLRVTTRCVFVSPARAIAEIDKVIADHPDTAYVVFLRAWIRTFGFVNGRVGPDPIRDGLADLDRTLRLNPTHVLALNYRAYLQAHGASAVFDPQRRAALFGRAQSDLRRAMRLEPTFGLSHYLSAYVHVLWGAFEPKRLDEAIAALERADALEFPCRSYVEGNKEFDPIRSHPAVRRIVGER